MGVAETGGAGTVVLATQLYNAAVSLLRPGGPSEAIVDEDGVRGRFIIDALAGIGLSMSGLPDGRGAAGNRVGSPDSMLYVFGPGDPEPRNVPGPRGVEGWGVANVLPLRTILDSRKRPGNFCFQNGRGTNSFSNGTPSRRITLLRIPGLSTHSSNARA